MLLIQAVLAKHQLMFCAERTPGPSAATPRATRGRIGEHPFAASSKELVAALSAAIPVDHAATRTDTITVWLPTVGGRPAPSSPLIGESPIGKSELRAWQVAVCTLAVDPVLDLLAGVGDRPTLALGIGVGVTLRYWGAALRFAAALVARQQFLPDVVRQDGEWLARWTPVIAGSDAIAFDRLAKAMPPAARAAGDTRPDRPAAEVLGNFIKIAVDAIVRGRTPEKPRSQFPSVHDRWMHALRAATGVLGGPEADAAQLAEQVREWRAPIAATVAAPFRLWFRLEEPADQDRGQKWHVRYPLQARDDPSLHLPAADVWAGRVRGSRADPRPILLAGRESQRWGGPRQL
ncbi:MAG: hypothetical protein K1X57_10920 [Gemmataceae bacterium]|nr:hypothetical protein [Gemmataceae bacterium]